jgi:molecular chaperone GrpE
MIKKQVNPAQGDEPIGAFRRDARSEPIPKSSPPTPEERIAAVEGEKAELYDRMLRIAADFDNWKKRARRDQVDGEIRSKESVLCDFLEIVDSLERATASWADGKEIDAKSVRDGVELVLRQFLAKLERYGVKPMQAEGAPFDPRMHEAVSQIPSSDVTPGSVLHELQKGYVIGETLLRPAMVVVAAAPVANVAVPGAIPFSNVAPDSGSR